MNLEAIKAKLVDVFAERKLTGNGLTIFWDYGDLSSKEMQMLTQEMRQFESVFVEGGADPNTFKARIFTMEEELDFAGHPLLGLAAHFHEEYGTQDTHEWKIELREKVVRLVSISNGVFYSAGMDQGPPEYIQILTESERREVLSLLSLSEVDGADIPFEVVSTGLPYLVVPVISGIEKVKIEGADFESFLHHFGAKFAYVVDVKTLEGRTWDNEGKFEDIATGSAAGPVAACLFKAGLVPANKSFQITQGRMVGRPSKIDVLIEAEDTIIRNIIVSGNVYKVASLSFA